MYGKQGWGAGRLANRNTRVRAGSQLGFYDRVNLNFQEANCLGILASLCCCFDQLRQRDFWHLPSDSTGALPGPQSFPLLPTLLIHFEKYFPAACVWRTLGAPAVAVRGRFSTYFLCFFAILEPERFVRAPAYVHRISMPRLAIDFYTIYSPCELAGADVHLIGCSSACTGRALCHPCVRLAHKASDSIMRFNLISHKRMIQMQIPGHRTHMPQGGGRSVGIEMRVFGSVPPFFG